MNNRLTILSAALVLASAPASADIVHLDDVIIDGSLCVGFDCVNGEAFGFDTIRLKENNVRIKFQDTSSSASFPTNDWQLTANDSSNGGANKFSIDDIDGGRTPFTIEASAPSHSLYVDDGGRIGFGTNAPVVDLHVVSGNTPTLRLAQDGSSGFSPQTWDVAGNETNFFIRDATNGSTLPFRIFPGSASNSIAIKNSDVGIGTQSPAGKFHVENTGGDDIDDFVVTSDGKVGLGTTTPNASIDIQSSDGSANLLIQETNGTFGYRRLINLENNGPTMIEFENTANAETVIWDIGSGIGDTFRINKKDTGAVNFILRHTNLGSNFGIDISPDHPIHHSSGARLTAAGVWTNASSRTLKHDIKPINSDEAMHALHMLEPVTYTYYAQEDETYAGFISEDVPDIVATKDRKTLSPMDIVAVLTKAIQEQDKRIDELNLRLNEIKEQP